MAEIKKLSEHSEDAAKYEFRLTEEDDESEIKMPEKFQSKNMENLCAQDK